MDIHKIKYYRGKRVETHLHNDLENISAITTPHPSDLIFLPYYIMAASASSAGSPPQSARLIKDLSFASM